MQTPRHKTNEALLIKTWADEAREEQNLEEFRKYMLIAGSCAVLVLMFLLFSGLSYADTLPQDKAVLAIIGEAEGESYQGKLALAYALINRGSFKGVYGLHAPRVIGHKYSDKTYKQALRAYKQALNNPLNDITHGATFWEGTAFKTPYWAKTMVKICTIGHQAFYRKV